MNEECTIFIVDDDLSLCRALARLLRSTGYQDVRTYSSAEDFITEASPDPCAIMILDLQLPGMSGIELIENLRSAGSSMPIILISAHDEQLARAREMRHEWAAFLHKPFEERELISVIDSLCAA